MANGLVRDRAKTARTDERKRIHIRWLKRKDVEEVVLIERDCFGQRRTPDEFVRDLRRRNRVGLVAEYGGRVVGYMVYELTRTQIRLLKLGISDDARSRHIGGELVGKLIQKLHFEGRTCVVCEVNERNLTAQLFFRSCGFRAVSILRPQNADTLDDTYVMRYRLCTAATSRRAPLALPRKTR